MKLKERGGADHAKLIADSATGLTNGSLHKPHCFWPSPKPMTRLAKTPIDDASVARSISKIALTLLSFFDVLLTPHVRCDYSHRSQLVHSPLHEYMDKLPDDLKTLNISFSVEAISLATQQASRSSCMLVGQHLMHDSMVLMKDH